MRRNALLLLGFLALLTVGAMSAAGAAPLDPPDASTARPGSAEAAVRAVTDDLVPPSRTVLPADFATVMGYHPAAREGRLVDRHGDCSTAWPLPADFDAACAEHDLGYDLLRYAALTGEPQDSWARAAVDTRMGEHMQEICSERTDGLRRAGCRLNAGLAVTAVRLNTVRQLYGVPEETPVSTLVTAGGGLLVLSCLAWPVGARLRRLRSARPRIDAQAASEAIA